MVGGLVQSSKSGNVVFCRGRRVAVGRVSGSRRRQSMDKTAPFLPVPCDVRVRPIEYSTCTVPRYEVSRLSRLLSSSKANGVETMIFYNSTLLYYLF